MGVRPPVGGLDGAGSGFWFWVVYVMLLDAGTHVCQEQGAWHETTVARGVVGREGEKVSYIM